MLNFSENTALNECMFPIKRLVWKEIHSVFEPRPITICVHFVADAQKGTGQAAHLRIPVSTISIRPTGKRH